MNSIGSQAEETEVDAYTFGENIEIVTLIWLEGEMLSLKLKRPKMALKRLERIILVLKLKVMLMSSGKIQSTLDYGDKREKQILHRQLTHKPKRAKMLLT